MDAHIRKEGITIVFLNNFRAINVVGKEEHVKLDRPILEKCRTTGEKRSSSITKL